MGLHRVLSLDLGRKHFACCILEEHPSDTSLSTIVLWSVDELKQLTARGICDFLREKGVMETPFDEVVIERQPGSNVHCVRQESLLEMYFFKEGKTVTFQDPRHKWIRARVEAWWGQKDTLRTKPTRTYYERKQLSIRVTEDFLGASEANRLRWGELFAGTKKRDDMADAFCQALTFMYPIRPCDLVIKHPPNTRQPQSWTMGNVAWVLRDREIDEHTKLLAAIETDPSLEFAVRRHFGDRAGSAMCLLEEVHPDLYVPPKVKPVKPPLSPASMAAKKARKAAKYDRNKERNNERRKITKAKASGANSVPLGRAL